MAALGGVSAPTYKSPQYSPSGLWLGVDSGGTRSTAIYRSMTYAALNADESGNTSWTSVAYRLSVWLK
jgi:hypothetical protein